MAVRVVLAVLAVLCVSSCVKASESEHLLHLTADDFDEKVANWPGHVIDTLSQQQGLFRHATCLC